jgi:enoyl-CoA hydratase/carnithine racemase
MAIDFKKEGRLAVFTLDRPQAMNAIDVATGRELGEAMVAFEADPELWVGIVTGAGDEAFCVGADIKDALPFMKENGHKAFPAGPMRGLEVKKPLIAAINGLALGGGLELALACDVRVASEKAQLGLPEVTLGLIPGWGGTQRLPRLIPMARAAEMILTGRPISAAEAHRLGLVNEVVPPDGLMAAARKWAEVICRAAPLAVRAAKEAMLKGLGLPLNEGMEIESTLEAYLLDTQDHAEGVTAFMEKRKPVYRAK